MQIVRKAEEPPTWEFNEVSEEDRRRVTAFIERSRHGTIVNPWEPFLVSFTEPAVIDAFVQEFGAEMTA